MSNNLKDHVYYNIIIRDMEKCAEKEFFKGARLLSINIDIELFDSNLNENLLDVRTSIEKKKQRYFIFKNYPDGRSKYFDSSNCHMV